MNYTFEVYKLYDDVYAVFCIDACDIKPLLIAFPLSKSQMTSKLHELERNTFAWVEWDYNRGMTDKGHMEIYEKISASSLLVYRKSEQEIRLSRIENYLKNPHGS